MANPYENYNVLDFLTDIPYSELHKFYTKGHQTYYNDLPEMVQKLRPELSGKRVDRNLQDMMYNFMGGYDMAARGMSPESAISGARAYQGKQYLFSDRKPDAVGDYEENVAGVKAFNPEQGRVSDEALIDMALKFARDRMAQSQRTK
mgnify:CR=1 FL=1